MKKRYIFIIIAVWMAQIQSKAPYPWSNLYKKIFTRGDKKRLLHKREILFTYASAPFTQLLFSWNAVRPQKGYLRFYGQVRDAKSKKWHPWHTMIDWGKKVQKSYLHKKEGATGYYHVRLEVPIGQSADAFRIRVRPFNGATLADLDGLFINTVHNNRYTIEKSSSFSNLASVTLNGVPKRSQRVLNHSRAKAMCSPTSLSMLTGYMCKTPINPLDVAKNVFDKGLNAYGSWPFNTAHAFELCGGTHRFYVQRLNSFADLHALLSKGTPIVVSVRGAIKGAQKPYKNGHLLLVVGWDQKKRQVICHDPAFYSDHETLSHYNITDFLTAWEKSRRLAYVAQQA